MELEKNIMLIPKNDFLDLESYNSFLNKFSYGKMNPLINTNDRNTSIAFESGFFDNVFYNIESLSDKNLELPITNLYFPIERNDEVIPIIKLSSNNSNIFSYKKISNAALYVFAMPFDKDYTDLQLNALFVPIMYKTSFSISGENSLSYYPNEKNIRLNSTIKSNDNLKLLCKTDSIFNAYVFENFNNNISLRFKDDDEAPASNYIVTQNNIAVDGFSINNSREESVFKFYDQNIIKQLISQYELKTCTVLSASDSMFEKDLASIINASNLWKIFLIVCILLIITEMILLRLWE